MPKALKFTLASVLVLLLLISLAIVGLVIFVDPNNYKNEIAAKVQDATGRQLTIIGDINYSLFPWIGVSLGKTELSNAEGFGDKPFASVDQVDIKVSVLPLFQQRLEMQKVRLHGLQAFLAKDKNGRSNWDDLITPTVAPAKDITIKETKKPEKVAGEEPTQSMASLTALAIEGLELENAQLEWNDQQTNQHVIIDKLTLHTGPLALPAPVDISLSMDVEINQPEIKEHLEFKGQVAANLTEQVINIRKLQLNTFGATLSGQADIKELDKTPKASGHIQLANVSPRELAGKLGVQLPETSDSSVLKKTRADIEFSASTDEARLNKLTLVFDDTELTGTASVINFAAPIIRFDLIADEVDVDRYLPPPSDKPAAGKTPPTTPGSDATTATPLPLEPLRTLDIDGEISLGKLKIVGAQLSKMKLGIKGKSGQMRLHPVQASLYSGQYNGDIGFDVRTDTPKISVNEKLSTVNIGPLLKDVLGKEYVSGTANITAQLTTSGTQLDNIKKTLNGKADFSFQDGKVNGVNIGQLIREAYAKLKKKPAPPKTENTTDFAEMSGSVTVTNGIVRNDNLTAKSPLLRIKGEGKVDLPKERINYLVNAAIVETNEGQTGKELEELKSHIIPIKVTGKLTNPKFGLDLGPVLQKRIKKQVDKRIKKEKKKIKKKIEEDLKKKLEEDLRKKLGF